MVSLLATPSWDWLDLQLLLHNRLVPPGAAWCCLPLISGHTAQPFLSSGTGLTDTDPLFGLQILGFSVGYVLIKVNINIQIINSTDIVIVDILCIK